jgi:hypothetical protein
MSAQETLSAGGRFSKLIVAGMRALTEFRMIETGKPSDARRPSAWNRDEYTLIERLVARQGLSRDEAVRTVGDYRKGKRVEIDPALMEGLDSI